MTQDSCGQSDRRNDSIEFRVVQSLDDWMRVAAIRAIVFMGEQNCPYDEEFDGNDFTGTQVLALVDGEPAATMRIRYFARLCEVGAHGRAPGVPQCPARPADLCLCTRFLRPQGLQGSLRSVSRFRLFDYMNACFGAELIGASYHFSDHHYHPIRYPIERASDHFTLMSDPMVMQRPEGDWDRPGVLEHSATRAADRSRCDP